MANKTNYTKNGIDYYRIVRVVGHKLNANGIEVPVRKEFLGKNKKEAEAKYQAFLDKKALNLDSSKQYFGVMADRWIYEFLIYDGSLKNSTKELYIDTWNKYIKPTEFYSLPLDKVSAGSIQTLYNSLYNNGCPISAIKTINKTMDRFYKYLVQHSYVPYNFTDTLTIPKEYKEGSKDITVWTDEELSCILNNFEKAQNDFRLRFLLVLAIYTGLRISELLGVKYEDIEKTQDGYILNVRRQISNVATYDSTGEKTRELKAATLKTHNSYRTIPLTSRVIDELKIHKKWHRVEQMKNGYRTDYIFTTETGGFYYKKSCETSCKRYYKRIGVEAKGFQVYRHTFATNLCKRGVPIQTAQILCGHSDISITAKYYVGIGEEEKKNAVALLEDIG